MKIYYAECSCCHRLIEDGEPVSELHRYEEIATAEPDDGNVTRQLIAIWCSSCGKRYPYALIGALLGCLRQPAKPEEFRTDEEEPFSICCSCDHLLYNGDFFATVMRFEGIAYENEEESLVTNPEVVLHWCKWCNAANDYYKVVARLDTINTVN